MQFIVLVDGVCGEGVPHCESSIDVHHVISCNTPAEHHARQAIQLSGGHITMALTAHLLYTRSQVRRPFANLADATDELELNAISWG